MESLLVALNAVIPFLCYISFGYIVRMKKIVSESFLQSCEMLAQTAKARRRAARC